MNRLNKLTAYFLLVILWGTQTAAIAQQSGLPANLVPFTTTAAEAAFANLTGCTTTNYVLAPATGNCIAIGASITYPSGTGIAVVTSGSSWGTTLTPPSSAIVGISDSQTLTNKSITGSEINSGTIAPAFLGTSETVSFSTTPTFSTNVEYSTISVTGAITTFTLAAGVAGQSKTLTFCENSTGGYPVTPPTNVHGFMLITSMAQGSKCNSQSYRYDTTQTAWLANSPGVLNE